MHLMQFGWESRYGAHNRTAVPAVRSSHWFNGIAWSATGRATEAVGLLSRRHGDATSDARYWLQCGVSWPAGNDDFACARFPLESSPATSAETPAPRRMHIVFRGLGGCLCLINP